MFNMKDFLKNFANSKFCAKILAELAFLAEYSSDYFAGEKWNKEERLADVKQNQNIDHSKKSFSFCEYVADYFNGQKWKRIKHRER